MGLLRPPTDTVKQTRPFLRAGAAASIRIFAVQLPGVPSISALRHAGPIVGTLIVIHAMIRTLLPCAKAAGTLQTRAIVKQCARAIVPYRRIIPACGLARRARAILIVPGLEVIKPNVTGTPAAGGTAFPETFLVISSVNRPALNM